MTRLVRLTDIQLVLLASAAARDNGSLLPPPETLGEGPARIRRVVEQLIRRGLAMETELSNAADAWRTEDNRTIGVIITDEGRAAIHVDLENESSVSEVDGGHEDGPPAPICDTAAPALDTSSHSKIAHVLNLLRRPEGATLDQLVAATSWLPHSTRAALTGLRKKGHAIERSQRENVSVYQIKMEA